jgi:hypothetical protein
MKTFPEDRTGLPQGKSPPQEEPPEGKAQARGARGPKTENYGKGFTQKGKDIPPRGMKGEKKRKKRIPRRGNTPLAGI